MCVYIDVYISGRPRPTAIMKTEHKHLRLLHDNAPAHKACTVTKFFESEMVNTPQPTPPTFPRSCPLCLLSILYLDRDIIPETPSYMLFKLPVSKWVWECFNKWNGCLKLCTQVGGEYFEGQTTTNQYKYKQWLRNNLTSIIFEHPS